MPRPSASIVSWLSATLAVAAPALVLLAILAAARELSWVLAGLGAAAVLLITGLITRRHLKDLAAVLAYAEALAAHQAAPTPYLAGTLPGLFDAGRIGLYPNPGA
jgi:hypothetical protein